jgi:hypothetical protein
MLWVPSVMIVFSAFLLVTANTAIIMLEAHFRLGHHTDCA